MSHTGQGQEYGNIKFPQEGGEWKAPMGILLLKSTYLPKFGLKTVELGVITGEEEVKGKKTYKFCRLADLFYTGTNKTPDSRTEIRNLLDDTLDESGKFSNGDGSRVEYKYLYQQDDMIEFVRKLSSYNRHNLFAILGNQSLVLTINEHQKQLLMRSLEIVNNEPSARNHNHRH